MFELSFKNTSVVLETSEQKDMGLRAFFYKIIRRGIFFYVLSAALNLTPSTALSQRLELGRVPYEIKFSDVTFQLNDLSRYLLSQEVAALSKNEEVKYMYLDRLSLVMPIVDPIIKDANVPEDFKYLSIYNKYQQSLSVTSALEEGVYWCMDMAKARDVNLVVNNNIDERKHLVIASQGAVVCLKRNQVLYDNWGTTLFAHLASKEVLIQLEVAKKWTGKYIVLDSPQYSSLIQFLAFKWVLENEFNGYKNVNQKMIYRYKHGSGKSLNLIAADLKLDVQDLANSNLWLKTPIVPDADLDVLIEVPSSKYNELRLLAEVSKNTGSSKIDLGFPLLSPKPALSKGKGGVFYSINNLKGIQAEMCDNFVTLAYKAGMSPEKFLIYNDITDKEVLGIGQVYYLETKNKKASIPHHIVRNEETLWEISQQYGVRLSKLLKYNRMSNIGRLQRERVIWLKNKRPKRKPIEYIETPVEKKIEYSDVLSNSIVNKNTSSEQRNTNVIETKKDVEEPYVSKVLVPNKNTIPKTRVYEPQEEEVVRPVIKKEVVTRKVESSKLFSEELKSKISNSENEDKPYLVHEVKRGETLYRISVNYKVSVNQLYKLNNLSSNIIEIGDKIIVKKY